jgi:hypothetical protein
MNLISLSQFPKIEIRFTYKAQTIIIWVEKINTYKDAIPQIKKMFNISEMISIDMLCGNFYINEFYTTIPFFKLIEIFFTNKFIIIDSNENPLNSRNIKDYKEKSKNSIKLPNEIMNFDEEKMLDKINKLKNEIKYSLNVYERRMDNLKKAEEEFSNLQKKAKKLNLDDDIRHLNNDDEDDNEIRELKEILFKEKEKCDNLELIMEKKFEKIISYKNQEKEALKLFRENKKIIWNIYTNEEIIADIDSTINRLNTKSKIFIINFKFYSIYFNSFLFILLEMLIINKKDLSIKKVKRVINLDKNVNKSKQ